MMAVASTHSRLNKHSTDADGDRGRSTLARERHAVCRITRPTSKETKTDRHNVFNCLYVWLLNWHAICYFQYAARQFAIRILTGTYDISFIVYRFFHFTIWHRNLQCISAGLSPMSCVYASCSFSLFYFSAKCSSSPKTLWHHNWHHLTIVIMLIR